jgi:hypothetical protein
LCANGADDYLPRDQPENEKHHSGADNSHQDRKAFTKKPIHCVGLRPEADMGIELIDRRPRVTQRDPAVG